VKEIKKGGFNQHYEMFGAIEHGIKEAKSEVATREWKAEQVIANGVKKTVPLGIDKDSIVSNDFGMNEAIQNGVKHTHWVTQHQELEVEDTIQNGVKHTDFLGPGRPEMIEKVIQNGVKNTYSDKIPHEYDWSNQFTEEIDDIIQNGVKHTHLGGQDRKIGEIKDIIQNGVKLTQGSIFDNPTSVKDTIQNGVKETTWTALPRHRSVEDTIQNGIKETKQEEHHRLREVVQTVKNGIKETTPGGYLGSVEMKGKTVHQFEHSKQDNDVEDVIESGIKATTTNYWLSEDKNQITEIEDVISNGIKKTEGGILFDESKIDTVISEGIKETIPVVPGDILDTIDFMSYNNTTNVQHLISDVIEKGIKETHDDVMPHTGRVEGVIKNGVKECIPSRTPLYNPMDFSVQYRENHRLDVVEIVLEKGIKEVQPLPAQDGNMDYSNYYYRQGESGKPHTKYVDDAIRDGVKETWGYEKQPQNRINEVIENGTKENPS
jgi:predicted peroxiredoxin